jgi:hypothetical protein
VRNLRSIAWTPGARYALAVVALALFGLLSMHGWGTHAGMHVETSQSPDHVALVHGDGHASAAEAPHPSQVAGSAGAMDADAVGCKGDCSGSGSGSGGGIGLVGLCLAALGGLVLALALLLLRRCIPLLGTMLPSVRHPVLLSRDRDPPDLLRLCVIRC